MCKPSNQFWCFVYTGCPGPARSPWLNYVNVHETQSRPRLPVDLLWTCNWILNSHLRELSPRFSAGVLLSNLTYPDGDKLTRQLSECSRYFLSRYWSIRIGNSSWTSSRICTRVMVSWTLKPHNYITGGSKPLLFENVKPMQNPVSVSSLFGTDCIELVKLKNIKYLE